VERGFAELDHFWLAGVVFRRESDAASGDTSVHKVAEVKGVQSSKDLTDIVLYGRLGSIGHD